MFALINAPSPRRWLFPTVLYDFFTLIRDVFVDGPLRSRLHHYTTLHNPISFLVHCAVFLLISAHSTQIIFFYQSYSTTLLTVHHAAQPSPLAMPLCTRSRSTSPSLLQTFGRTCQSAANARRNVGDDVSNLGVSSGRNCVEKCRLTFPPRRRKHACAHLPDLPHTQLRAHAARIRRLYGQAHLIDSHTRAHTRTHTHARTHTHTHTCCLARVRARAKVKICFLAVSKRPFDPPHPNENTPRPLVPLHLLTCPMLHARLGAEAEERWRGRGASRATRHDSHALSRHQAHKFNARGRAMASPRAQHVVEGSRRQP